MKLIQYSKLIFHKKVIINNCYVFFAIVYKLFLLKKMIKNNAKSEDKPIEPRALLMSCGLFTPWNELLVHFAEVRLLLRANRPSRPVCRSSLNV